MGHVHLLRLPQTRKWRAVAELLDHGAASDDVVAASAVAAEKQLLLTANDPSFVEALRLLAMIPQAASAGDFRTTLHRIDLIVPSKPTLFDLIQAAGKRLEEVGVRSSHLPFFVRSALLSTLTSQIGGLLPGLFAPDAGDVKAAAARLSRPENFAAAARQFLGHLTGRILASYLDRALSAHAGQSGYFRDAEARKEFDTSLERYCSEATRIVREFAGGWYSKTLFREGQISTERAAAFGGVAVRKITEELKRKRGVDD